MPYASVYLTINPEVRIDVSRRDTVVDVEGMKPDGSYRISSWVWKPSKKFCLLRAESVRGQLDGTIPSTITAQAKGKSIFVDASVIWLPDMGEIADMKDGYHSQNPSEPSEGFLYTILTPPL